MQYINCVFFQVLIDVNYCALNGLDVLLSENLYSYEQNLPFVPGYELSGKLIEVSEKAKEAGYHVGDKVVALNKGKFGGLAEQCVADINVSVYFIIHEYLLQSL